MINTKITIKDFMNTLREGELIVIDNWKLLVNCHFAMNFHQYEIMEKYGQMYVGPTKSLIYPYPYFGKFLENNPDFKLSAMFLEIDDENEYIYFLVGKHKYMVDMTDMVYDPDPDKDPDGLDATVLYPNYDMELEIWREES